MPGQRATPELPGALHPHCTPLARSQLLSAREPLKASWPRHLLTSQTLPSSWLSFTLVVPHKASPCTSGTPLFALPA